MTSAVFAVGTLVAFAQPDLALYLLLSLIPIRIVEGRLERASAGAATG